VKSRRSVVGFHPVHFQRFGLRMGYGPCTFAGCELAVSQAGARP